MDAVCGAQAFDSGFVLSGTRAGLYFLNEISEGRAPVIVPMTLLVVESVG
jgi:hypothetical protein